MRPPGLTLRSPGRPTPRTVHGRVGSTAATGTTPSSADRALYLPAVAAGDRVRCRALPGPSRPDARGPKGKEPLVSGWAAIAPRVMEVFAEEQRNREERPVSLRLDIATIAKIHSDRIYDLILPEREDQETVTVPFRSSRTYRARGRSWKASRPATSRGRWKGSRGRRRSNGSGGKPSSRGESCLRRGRVPEGGGVGGEGASVSSTTQAPSSPGPAEPPPADTRPIRGRPGGARVFRPPSSPGVGHRAGPGWAGLRGGGRPGAGGGVRRERRPGAPHVGRDGRQAGLALRRVVPPRDDHDAPDLPGRTRACGLGAVRRPHGRRGARDDARYVPRDRAPVQGRPRRGGPGGGRCRGPSPPRHEGGRPRTRSFHSWLPGS